MWRGLSSMAGVVAMASVIEDFDTPLCKKTCKDVDSPVVKTITNYFSPVSKPAEKPFSPPRSNNILDYFNRKAPSPKDRVQSKENCQTGKNSTPPSVTKQPATKRSRKASKTARKLVETAEDSSCIIVEEIDSTDNGARSSAVVGSDTAFLLGQICSETSVSVSEAPSNYQSVESDQQTLPIKRSKHLNSITLSPILPPKEKSRKGKTSVANSKRKKQQEDQLLEPELKETEKSLGEISMEVNVGDASQLNNSTVTISFEEFVRSQDHTNNEICEETESLAGNEQLQIADAEDNQKKSCLHISPRTVTVQAEVHTISPKEEGKNMGKVASIFTKEKGTGPVQMTSPQPEPELQVLQTASKWKSNVVLEENDVELCVLESSATPKCNQAERKQFMAAFKQPSFDGTKNKPVKSQGKQKQSGDQAEDTNDKFCEEEPENQCAAVLETDTTASQNEELKKKPAKKRQKKANVKKDTTLTPVTSEKEAEVVEGVIEIDSKKEDQSNPSPPAPVVRRSRREAVTRQTSKSTVAESLPKQTRKKVSTEESSAPNQKDLVDLTTPKKRKPKHGMFKAEMMCPPDEMESPIRIRFSRVNRSKEGNASAPLVPKNTKESKKTKQAKKLLEKAKARQQNKKVSRQEKTLRRSSRTEASFKRSYCEDEDSVICVEDGPQTVPEKGQSKTSLRSLNEVLGKAASNKTMPGSKVQEKIQDKASRKPPPVSIFDDGSQDGSENSQDDEHFKARREFLKSGLPESFKKQMAKTAAVKEAYATACSSFQPVMHIYQPPNECPFWSLPWPQSAFLHHLKEIECQFSSLPLLIKGLINWKTEPVHSALSKMVSSWRPEISAVAHEAIMKEISISNPTFPVQKFMSHFLKKQADLLHQGTASELSSVSKGVCPDFTPEATGGKRKRTEGEEETVKVAKKQRGTRPAEGVPAKKEGRTRRGAKSVSEGPSQTTTPVQSGADAVIVLDDSPLGPKTVEQDVLMEDVLWTDKYQPQHSSEVIGNTSSVRQLYSWLKEWKLRADKEDKKKLKDQKQEEGVIDSDWECGEEDYAEDMLCNTMLITGPSGIGKTAAVYACAQELGFKIFEVNASSQRSGRLILSQLKEATQSHQVDTQGVNAHKPTYFSSYSASSSAARPGSSPRKVDSPRRAVSSPRKLPHSPRTSKRGGLAPTALANFFKMSKPGNKEQPKAKEEQSDVSKKKKNEVCGKNTSLKSPPDVFSTSENLEEPSKKTATSLILFEEVDVIFEEDTGFLSAIKTFMTTTKRPVILTTSDPAFSAMFDGNFEEIVFKPPSVLNVASYLQLLCLSENVRTDMKDISSLLSLNRSDIRRTLLQLQFWTRSGGQHTSAPPSGQNEDLLQKQDSEMKDPDSLPNCETGCTESMLGLFNIAPQHNIWELLKRQEADFSQLVTLSRGQGVDLLYSNMETLLPLPTTTLPVSNHKPQRPIPPPSDQPSVNPPRPHKLPSHARLGQNEEDFSDDASPVKVSSRMKKNRRKHCPPEQGALRSDSDSEDEFLSLKRRRSAAKEKEDASFVPLKVIRKPLSREERTQSVPVSQCLQSLADFLDDMSLMDFLSNGETNLKEIYSAAVLKDGLTDEARIESERRDFQMQGCALEIHAQVESLSFNKCSVAIGSAWHRVQQFEGALREETTAQLTLPVASLDKSYTFTQNGLCPPQVVQQRRNVMDDLCLKGVFGSVGNMPAAAQDYLPTLRTICRSEQLKEQGKIKRRFLHYLDSIHLGLQKSTLEHLAEDFP